MCIDSNVKDNVTKAAPERWNSGHMHRKAQQMRHCINLEHPLKLHLVFDQNKAPQQSVH